MATQVKGITLDTTVLDRITKEMRPEASRIINTWGLKIASDASIAAPYETGALSNSLLSESHMEGDLTFIVQDGTTYGVFQELGTSKMAAHPFLVPAVEKNEQAFLKAFEELFK